MMNTQFKLQRKLLKWFQGGTKISPELIEKWEQVFILKPRCMGFIQKIMELILPKECFKFFKNMILRPQKNQPKNFQSLWNASKKNPLLNLLLYQTYPLFTSCGGIVLTSSMIQKKQQHLPTVLDQSAIGFSHTKIKPGTPKLNQSLLRKLINSDQLFILMSSKMICINSQTILLLNIYYI